MQQDVNDLIYLNHLTHMKFIRNIKYCCALFIACSFSGEAQVYTHADTLKGSVTKEREWWDVNHYDLHASFNYADSSITGFNRITYTVLKPYQIMQLDLMSPMVI